VSRATVIAALLTASLMAACGSDDEDTGKTGTTAKAAKTTTSTAAPKVSVEQATASCHTVADPLVNALHKVDDAAGLSQDYSAYRATLREARVTFRRFDFDANQRAGNCLVVVVAPATEALNHYGTADQLWSQCDESKHCAKVGTEWKTAGDFLVNAESGFTAVKAKAS